MPMNRRKFLGTLAAGTGGLLLTKCKEPEFARRRDLFNNKSADKIVPGNKNHIYPESTVGIVQSEKNHVEDLNYEDIRKMVHQAIEYAGGFENLIHNNDIVVLKPNIMCLWINSTGQKLIPDANGVTADWRVTRAVVELVRKYNPDGKVFIIESSAFQCTELAMMELKYMPDYIPGVDAFLCLENCSGNYEEWDSSKLSRVTLPNGVGLYPDSMKPNLSPEFYLNRLYYEADVVISLPVLKNHTHTGITGALKNVSVGASPPNIYGKLMEPSVTSATQKIVSQFGRRLELNRWYKINHDPIYLDTWIHDYFLCRPVDFVVTDGLNGLQNGPDISKLVKQKSLAENLMNMRTILAGRDALAVDTVHALLIGMDPAKIEHLVLLSNKGIGCTDPARIKIQGKMVHQLKKSFEMNYERSSQKMYSKFNSPEFKVKSAFYSDDKLNIELGANPREISKIEIAVNGQLLETAVVGGYDTISLDIGPLHSEQNQLDIYAYDCYLNCAHKSQKIKRSIA
ncbi:DUF362 domain-containing protein [candidate division KSB1 bacterium]|nr:DUF362 domain-containing protein [candidate division KSB1 bacterium]